jgi:hypothetical protein
MINHLGSLYSKGQNQLIMYNSYPGKWAHSSSQCTVLR